MVAIRIKDHVQQASSYDDGQVIYDLISSSIFRGEEVLVSFDGISAVPSAFVNAAFLQLVEHVSLDHVKQCLRIADSTKFINDLIRRRFDFVNSNIVPSPVVRH